MTEIFTPTGDGIIMRLHVAEIELLTALHDGLESALQSPTSTNPVIERLFPAAVDGDASANSELRRLMRDDLLAQRRNGLALLTAILTRTTPADDDERRADDQADGVNNTRTTVVSGEEAHVMLGVLNDLRLAIASQLPPDVLTREDEPDDQAVRYRLDVMDHLAWMLHHLLVVLDPAVATDEEDLS